jgi:hypothetical protein
MPYALGPVVVIVPLLISVLPLPLAATPSLKAPVVLIVPLLVSALPLVLPSIAAPRLVPLPPPPVSVSVPLFVMVLLDWTLRRGNGTAVACTALTDAPGLTLMVTPVLPATAATGVVLVPEQVTVVPLAGAVFVHWAIACEVSNASNKRKMIAPATPLTVTPSLLPLRQRFRAVENAKGTQFLNWIPDHCKSHFSS